MIHVLFFGSEKTLLENLRKIEIDEDYKIKLSDTMWAIDVGKIRLIYAVLGPSMDVRMSLFGIKLTNYSFYDDIKSVDTDLIHWLNAEVVKNVQVKSLGST